MQTDSSDDIQDTEASFGERVRAARRRRGWTQKDLGARVNLDASAISRLEAGTRAIRLGEASQIAHVLRSGLDELVYGEQQTAHAQFEIARAEANEHMSRMHYSAVEAVRRYTQIAALLEEFDELFETFSDTELGPPPTNVDEYMEWSLARVLVKFGPEQRNRLMVDNEKRASQLRAIVAGVVHNVVVLYEDSTSE